MVVENGDHDTMSESFRLLRTKVDFLGARREDRSLGRVIMVTSLQAGMGKTFISTNLSASFGITGKRVIVLDLDLLLYGEQRLHLSDWERPYIQALFDDLSRSTTPDTSSTPSSNQL